MLATRASAISMGVSSKSKRVPTVTTVSCACKSTGGHARVAGSVDQQVTDHPEFTDRCGYGGDRRGRRQCRERRHECAEHVSEAADEQEPAERPRHPSRAQYQLAHRDQPQPEEHRAHRPQRSEEHTSELQSLMRISYAVFCLKTKKTPTQSN